MTYAVVSQGRTVEQLSYLVDETISRALLSVPGVAEIRRVGVDREIRVDLNPSPTSPWITARVNDKCDFNMNLPGGRAEVGGSEQTFGRWAVPPALRC